MEKSKTWEELADLEAHKKAGRDCCEWFLESIWVHRTRSAASVEMPSDELVYRKLGVNLDKPYTKAVLESLVESEQHARHEPHFSTVAELLVRIDWLDGWKDQQAIADNIKALIATVRKPEYRTEIGEDYRGNLVKYFEEQMKIWDDKTSDPPSFLLSFELPTKYNVAFHRLLERISEHCLKAYFEVSGEFDLIIGSPEDIAGHPIERAKPQAESVQRASFTKEEVREISEGIEKFRNFEKEKAKLAKDKRDPVVGKPFKEEEHRAR